MKNKIKYWYKKYTPIVFQKFSYLISNMNELMKIGLFNFEMNEDTRMSKLTWAYANSSQADSVFLSKITEYINAATLVDLKFDSHLEPDNSRQYEFEYMNMNLFPGEHYRILVGILNTENFKNFTEIGTGSGVASKTILNQTNADIKTFDIVPWREDDSHLTRVEFNNSRLTQIIEDLSNPQSFKNYSDLIANSDMILLDADKSGTFEDSLLTKMSTISFESKFRLLFIDDIRYFSMYKVWKKIKNPKIDLTSFGHWSGSGLVDITNGLIYQD
jgi:predicted O-methyltransferase YrrM